MTTRTARLAAAGFDWPAPATYALRTEDCVVEVSLRILGMRTRHRFTATGGRFTAAPDPRRSTLLIELDASPRRLDGPPLGGLLKGRRTGALRGTPAAITAHRLRRTGRHGFRMRGEVDVGGHRTPAAVLGRFVDAGDAPVMVAEVVTGTAAVFLPRAPRVLIGRRMRFLIGAAFHSS
jgi:hypothetical protein